MKQWIFLFLVILLMTFTMDGCLYHKPVFEGKVVDAETKEPIEGAVAVVVYNKASMGAGAGSIPSIINIKEALTDKEGIFRIPSYTTVIIPFTWQTDALFIIFKPGYGAFPKYQAYPPALGLHEQEIFFSGGIGVERELNAAAGAWKHELTRLKLGIVELPKLKTREERSRNIPSLPSWDDLLEKQANLIRLINVEEENLGMQTSDPYKARGIILNKRR